MAVLDYKENDKDPETHLMAIVELLGEAVFPDMTYKWGDFDGNPKPFHWQRLVAIKGKLY
jgi:hypothetical protein